MEDITGKNGLAQKTVKDAVEHILGQELEDYISKKNSGGDKVARNGSTTKNIKAAYGNIGVRVPRTREPGFEPEAVKKRAVIDEGLEPQVTSMYAKGMGVRDIAEHLQALHGIEPSAASISNIAGKASQEAKDRHCRTLESFCPVASLDAVHFKVREEGRIVAKAAYVALGISGEGFKGILGIWIGESEGAKFWLKVCNGPKNRGVQDIPIACMDGLNGFPDAIRTVFPQARIQLRVIHQIRNAIKYVSYKDQKAFLPGLKKAYGAESEGIALRSLEAMQGVWKKYGAALDNWLDKWDSPPTYFCCGYRIRRLIYTANTVEGFNRRLGKATKSKAVFPSDDALRKPSYLCTRDITKKRHMPRPNR